MAMKGKKKKGKLHALAAVDDSAVPPDLPLGAGLDLQRRKPGHGPREQLEEDLLGPGRDALDVGARRRVGEQRGVGAEQAPALEQRAVVAQVERQVAARVHLHHAVLRVPAARRPALAPPQVGRVGRVQGRVGLGRVVAGRANAAAWVAVQAVREGGAVRDADRVRAWSRSVAWHSTPRVRKQLAVDDCMRVQRLEIENGLCTCVEDLLNTCFYAFFFGSWVSFKLLMNSLISWSKKKRKRQNEQANAVTSDLCTHTDTHTQNSGAALFFFVKKKRELNSRTQL